MMNLSLLMVAFATAVTRTAAQSKMISHLPVQGRRLVDEAAAPKSSNYTIFIGECFPRTPLTFPVSAGSGRGVIGIMDSKEVALDVGLSDGDEGTISIEGEKVSNYFAAIGENDDSTAALRLTFEDIMNTGATATLSCDQRVDLVVAYKDEVELALEYEVTFSYASSGAVRQQVSLRNRRAAKPVTGSIKGKGKNNGEVNAKFKEASDSGIVVEYYKPGDVVIIQAEVVDEDTGKAVQRTTVFETSDSPPPVAAMELHSSVVSDDGDLEVIFSNLPKRHLLLKTRIGIKLQGKDLEETVDTSTIVDDGKVVVHGGWIRNQLENSGVKGSTNGWKVFVVEAAAFDPENNYHMVAELSGTKDTAVSKNKQLLSASPSEEERGISMDMKRGRPPPRFSSPGEIETKDMDRDGNLRSRRHLQSNHAKIIVHGYCATPGTFDMNHFTNAVEFSDPDATGNPVESSWTNNEFALKIIAFANNNGLIGCGIIAHSQGGLASLHLYTFFWSCLDNAELAGTRLIQSVGSPYQGTALAGNLASIGEIFGVGCGFNGDLTESGAEGWLSLIPSWARAEVTYYTTSFKDNWWSYDYCDLVSDVMLSDPDDGVIEKSRGQLPGGVNGGHKEGWCHTTGMEEPAQYGDLNRNSFMNNNARF